VCRLKAASTPKVELIEPLILFLLVAHVGADRLLNPLRDRGGPVASPRCVKAAIEALKSGQLGGMAIDVYEQEAGLFFKDYSKGDAGRASGCRSRAFGANAFDWTGSRKCRYRLASSRRLTDLRRHRNQ
jgi:hypothetical protein